MVILITITVVIMQNAKCKYLRPHDGQMVILITITVVIMQNAKCKYLKPHDGQLVILITITMMVIIVCEESCQTLTKRVILVRGILVLTQKE